MTSNILEGLTVLLVDDEVYSQQVFGKALASMGKPEVLTADNGAKALKILSDGAHKVDIIISDFNMPVVHGLQLLKAVRVGLKEIDRATPFAMLTGYSDKRLVDMALALDINAFLVKPASHEALNKRLGKLLSQTKTDLWLKEAENYTTINVDEVLNEIAKPDVEPAGMIDLPLMPKNKALFRRSGAKGGAARGLPGKTPGTVGVPVRGLPDAPCKKAAGVEAKWVADISDGDWTRGNRPHLEGRLCLIGELPESAIIARDIHTADGRLLMHTGTELTPRIVSILNDLHDLEHPVKEIWIATEEQ